jgi:hypothetical protein
MTIFVSVKSSGRSLKLIIATILAKSNKKPSPNREQLFGVVQFILTTN